MTKKDLLYSIITGLLTGLIAWRLLEYLRTDLILGVGWRWLVILVPIIWIMGVGLGYGLGRWFGFFRQLGKFVAVGFTNAAVDFGVLNLLIAWTGFSAGLMFALFKAASFIVANIHSYFWNKFWVFESREKVQQLEIGKFFVVSVASLLINVGVATLVVNGIEPFGQLSTEVWANVGAAAGSAAALLFNFVGYRFIVFKANKSSSAVSPL